MTAVQRPSAKPGIRKKTQIADRLNTKRTLGAKAENKPGRKLERSRRQAKLPGPLSYLLDEAAIAGLLVGEKSEHITARTTPALVAEAQRRTGITSKTMLIEVALASLAMPDPVAKFMKEHRGELGKDHELDY